MRHKDPLLNEEAIKYKLVKNTVTTDLSVSCIN